MKIVNIANQSGNIKITTQTDGLFFLYKNPSRITWAQHWSPDLKNSAVAANIAQKQELFSILRDGGYNYWEEAIEILVENMMGPKCKSPI